MNRNFRNNGRRDGVDPITRARARRRALQAVYAWQMSGGEAVSYTHLDVYKRQPWRRSMRDAST